MSARQSEPSRRGCEQASMSSLNQGWAGQYGALSNALPLKDLSLTMMQLLVEGIG